ncbi:MAG: adenosylcobinamide-GDP ribazoletransferase, partial [Planctomycetes bacterium]|nr:adenosylcobinamide-GDP ribazoletransferase [Planctomycetota bacterium]
VLTARCLALCLAAGSAYPRPEGTGKALIEAVRGWEAGLFATLALLATAGLVAWRFHERSPGLDEGFQILVVFSLPLGAVLALRELCRRRLGGVTGDCLGAAIEITELLFLVTWTIVPRIRIIELLLLLTGRLPGL